MGWFVALAALLFYLIGLVAFRAIEEIRILPYVAIAVILIDRFLAWKYRKHRD